MSDMLLVFVCIAFSWVILGLVVRNSNRKELMLWINLGIQAAYSLFYFYNLLYNSSGGTALVWWFMWIVVTGIHVAIMLGILVYLRLRKK